MNRRCLLWISRRVPLRYLALAALLSGIYFLIVLAIMHVLRTDLDVYSSPISHYYYSDTSLYLVSGFLLAGCGEVILAALLPLGYKDLNVWGRVLLFLAGVGALLVGLQRVGTIHLVGALFQAVCFPVGVLLLADGVEKGSFKRYSQVTSFASLTLVPLLAIGFNGASVMRPYFGLLEKLLALVMMCWSLVVLVHLYRSAEEMDRIGRSPE